MMRIALADNSKTICSALRLLVEMETDVVVAGEAANGAELLELIDATQPEIAMVDLDLPQIELLLSDNGNSGILGESRSKATVLQVIVMGNDPQAGSNTIASTADQYVCKGGSPERLLDAINTAVTASRQTAIDTGEGDDTHANIEQ